MGEIDVLREERDEGTEAGRRDGMTRPPAVMPGAAPAAEEDEEGEEGEGGDAADWTTVRYAAWDMGLG